MRKFITTKEFRNNPAQDALVLKQGLVMPPEQVGHESSRTLRFVISNEIKDRSGDICKLDGWKLANYVKNPLVLFEHDADMPPIGKCVEIGIIQDNLVATVEFMPTNIPIYGPRAEAIFQMCKTGYLNATSVGFKVLDYEREEKGDGTIFKEMELMEFSIVTIPDNPTALILGERSYPALNNNTAPKSVSNINTKKVQRERELILLEMKSEI